MNNCRATGCQNGGVCDPETDKCACPEDYRGARCEKNIEDLIATCVELERPSEWRRRRRSVRRPANNKRKNIVEN